MPRGGRRPGAGAPKGNLNGLRSGRASARSQVVLAALLSNAEIRDVLIRLNSIDAAARDEIRQIIVASARVLFDHPVNEGIQRIAEGAAADYLAKLPPGHARRAVDRYKRQLGFDDLLPRARHPRAMWLDDPAFLDFASRLLGVDLRRPASAPAINPADILSAASESDPPELGAAIENAIGQSNPEGASSSRGRSPRPAARIGDSLDFM